MKKIFPQLLFIAIICFNAKAQVNKDCWTLINKGVDIYNGQYNNGEFPGYHDPETTDLEEVNGGFLTTGQYNKQTFDSKDNNIYTNLEDKDGGYLTKHDYNGNLKWIVYTEKNINSYRDVMFGSAEDNEGNIYVIGHSVGGTFFDSKGRQTTFINTNNFSSGFIVKLDGNGELLWHITIDNVFSKKINIDDNGNLLLSGDISIYNNFKFNFYLNGVITDNLSNFEIMGNNSNYVNRGILKINPEGELLWYTSIKTNGPNSEFLIDIGSDKNNNIYVTGYCGSNAEIYSAGKTNNPNTITWGGPSSKTFLIKFDENGQFVWKVKSSLDDSEINGVLAWSTTVDEQGNSYISGSNDRWRKDVNHIFENTDGSITSENVGTFFIAKVNANGICEWIKGAAHSYSGTGYKVIKSKNEIITVGSVSAFRSVIEEVEFLSTDGNNINASFYVGDYFLAVYDLDGNIKRVLTNGINEDVFFGGRISGFFKDSDDNYYLSRNSYFSNNNPKDYINFGHIIKTNTGIGQDGTISKFNESCGIKLGKSISDNISNLSLCDDTSVGTDFDGLIELDLTLKKDEILINESLLNYKITYFKDSLLNQPILKPEKYINSFQIEKIHVKAEHLLDANKTGQTSFILEVIELPKINTSISLKQCDDDIDGFSLFNLTEVNSKIVPNPSDYTITYFEQKTNAETNNAPIININTYKNKSASNDKIWARVENSNSCYRISEIDLIVSTTQIPTSFKKEFFVCDNGLNITDGIATFDFSSSTEEIKNIFPANQQLIISYYSTLADALSESNSILNISSFQNTNSPNQQIIYTRVDSVLDNECLGLGPHIILNVDKIPKANPIIISPVCDTDRDGLYSFDTSTFQNMLIENQNNVEVIYFDQKGNTLPSPLPNPFITATQKVTARVTNSLSQDPLGKCSDETIINFVVNSVPLANPVTPQIICDTDFDGIYSFDTSLIHNTILGGQTNIKVSYFDDNGNALSNPLPNPFITTSTEITVRLENLIQPACSDETIVSFVVREKPYFELIEEAIICMDNDPKLNLSIENPAENYSYEWTDENAIIKSNSSNFIATKGGVYTVVATNQFGCVSEKKQVLVTESSRAQLKSSDIKIIEDSENNSIQVLTENLGIGSYEFRLKDFNGTILVDYQNSPIFNNLIGGIYILEVNDKNGCGYISKNVSILSFPKFFTPNNDGINDTWQVKGIGKNYYTKGRVIIFNRFGKNLFDFSIFDRGWDGNYFGKKLPSNDYWFSIRLMDIKGVLRIRNGSFSLIRK